MSKDKEIDKEEIEVKDCLLCEEKIAIEETFCEECAERISTSYYEG